MEKNKTISQEELEQWIQRAEEGDCEMQYQLGEYYYTGAKKDYRRALAYYLQAAVAGHALAQRRAGEMYMSGKKIGKNMNEATKWSTSPVPPQTSSPAAELPSPVWYTQ